MGEEFEAGDGALHRAAARHAAITLAVRAMRRSARWRRLLVVVPDATEVRRVSAVALRLLDMCGLSSMLPPKKRASEMNDEHSNPQAWAAGGGGARRPTLSFGFHPAARFN